ncbi:hypothetical protein [Legionella cardiaca]|uniref:Uncharacterized protein n=1 Tax=Legionella cardiaca TaxID=1071983 RepID=A0ABY8AXN2_9GAMM|nr:hypothetical protein [Legionella cardiaca]WED44491.1 hypothetical protein PXX05_06820 [Legionella cardiaca]
MSRGIEETIKMTSDSLHNKNCFSYLQQLKLSNIVLSNLSPALANSLQTIQYQTTYNPDFAYADVYTNFFTEVETNIEKIYDIPKYELARKQAQIEQFASLDTQEISESERFLQIYIKSLGDPLPELKELNDFIFSIYDNDNDILSETFEVIKNIPLSHTPVNNAIEGSISNALKDRGTKINKYAQSPAQAGSLFGRFTAMISDNFKPQHTTSLATLRKYRYTQDDSRPREYRFGTQGQRDQGIERVSPLFERWLQVKAERAASDSKITHIYFNNLGLDRTDAEGRKESALTRKLHQLEERHPNIAVITLPADKGLMSGGHYRKVRDSHDYAVVYDEFLKIASQDSNSGQTIKDFYISDNVRQLAFQNANGEYTKEIEKDELKKLLDKSFKVMGITPGTPMSSAQKQAIWFHFIKFELTNHIIKALQPQSINFSCKDAIDRGGVSSAYYNLLKSFEEQTPPKINAPMTREEFECALHAAPAMVKARGMNHHLKIIWNAVNNYVNANYDELKTNTNKAWLIEWRDVNCPHHRVKDLLNLRVEQGIQELRKANADYPDEVHPSAVLINKSLHILEQIKSQKNIGVSGKRLLLEAAVRTPQITLNPNEENIEAYSALADKLVIHSPKLQMLAGIMKTLIGAILFLPSLGFSKELINSGIATFKAGTQSQRRKEIQNNMKEQLHHLKVKTSPVEDESETDAEAFH